MRLRAWLLAATAAPLATLLIGARPPSAAESGEALYAARCAQCHDRGEQAPAKDILRSLSVEKIEDVLTAGVMQPMAAGLTAEDRHAIAAYLGRPAAAPAQAAIPACDAREAGFDYAKPPASNGFGVTDASNARLAPDALAGLAPAALPRLRPKWSIAAPKPTFPLIAGGTAFTTTLDGEVLALSAETGCLRWRFPTGGSIRSGLVLAPWRGAEARPAAKAPLLYFGDRKGVVYALNAATGEKVWAAKAHDSPFANVLATPALHEGRLYVGFASNEGDIGPNADPKVSCCTFRGMVAAFDAATGEVLWRYSTIKEPARPIRVNAAGVQQYGPSGAAVLGTPTIDARRGLLYATADNNYSDPRDGSSNSVYALDLETGREVWHRKMSPGNPHNAACYVQGTNCPSVYDEANRSDWGFKAPPVIVRTGRGDVLVAAQKSGAVWGFAPASGEVLWEISLTGHKVNYGVLQGVAVHGGAVYATVGEFLKKPADGPFAGMEELGLYKLDAATGKVLWSAPTSADCPLRVCAGYWDAPLATGGMVLAVSTDQFLRVYDEATGKLLRRVDLDLDGGPRVSTSGGGPSVADGVVYVGTDRKLVALTSR